MYNKAHIVLTEKEKEDIEIADFGLDDFYKTGLSIVTYVNTDNCCAKEMVLHPFQTCPEHIHAPIEEIKSKGKKKLSESDMGKYIFMLKVKHQRKYL